MGFKPKTTFEYRSAPKPGGSGSKNKQGSEGKKGATIPEHNTTNTTDLKNGASSFRNAGPNVGTSRTGNVNNNVQDESNVVEESESDVEDIYDETAHFMASECANDASLYEDDDYDIYDNNDIQGLSKSNWCFVTRWIFVFEVLIDDKLYLASLLDDKEPNSEVSMELTRESFPDD
nr:hypothetical protein [Tanacetum cinerariifolium]